ncbi:MAG: hypothetical protein GF364_18250 [Candidatus Lokiarchaeota archaeon]|nr:hypothetical protein [Candidatus Lokiarchaeota archaeon]
MNADLDKIFNKIREDLDAIDEKREKLLSTNRNIVRNCSEIIKLIHRNELESIDEKLNQVSEMIKEIEQNALEVNAFIGKNYLNRAKQEFAEAALLYSVIKGDKLPDLDDLNLNAYEYILGAGDLIGELKRLVLNRVRDNDIKNAEQIYDFMDELLHYMFSLDYPDGLIPGVRRKIDVGRKINGKTLELITTSKNNADLNSNIKTLIKKINEKEEKS